MVIKKTNNTEAFRRNLGLIAALAFSNTLALAVSLWLGLGRPYINIDYILAATLIGSRLRWLGFAFLLLAITTDTLLITGQIFPIIRIADALYLLKFVFLPSATYQVAALATAIGISVAFYFFWRLRDGRQFKGALILLNLALILYTFQVFSVSAKEKENRFWRVSERPLVSSQAVYFFDYRNRGFIKTYHLTGEPFSPAAQIGASHIWSGTENSLSDRILLVVSESWGVAKNPQVQSAIIQPLTEIKDHVEWIRSGELTFSGPTVAGELRELCQLRPNHFNLASVTTGFENCLPNLLRNQGYSTKGMHGAIGLMYDRIHWYPRAGFDDLTFYESKIWPSRCYSFPGACDTDLMREVKEEFSLPGRRFLYWLTLNTHSIYDRRDIKYDIFNCETYMIDPKTQSCRNLQLHAQFFHKLAETLQDSSMQGVEVLVVGDHQPPIFDAEERDAHFEDKKVSWVHMKLK